jgi:hypothetical protein
MEKVDIERRKTFVETLSQTGSMKKTLDVTSKNSGVTKNALRADWCRRASWPKEVFEGITDPVFTFLYVLEIQGALRQIEQLIQKTDNPNCKLGAIRTKVDTLFKLVNLQRASSLEAVLARIEKLEVKFDALQKTEGSNPEEDED